MKGLDLARNYYLEFGKPMLEDKFKEYENYLAIGKFGSGSECYGFDDEISKDHDFEPGFQIFLSEEIDEDIAFQIEREYNKLPKEYMGFKRSLISPGEKRNGVFRINEFFNEKIGNINGKLSIEEWFKIPEYLLSELTNGEIFKDNSNLLIDIRNNIKNMPRDVLLKKIEANLYIMGQSGKYNYERCLNRNELSASKLALNEFVESTMHIIFLLNRTYMPYYKWSFKALRSLPKLSISAEILDYLLNSENNLEDKENKLNMIDCLISLVVDELNKQGFSSLKDEDLNKQIVEINKKIEDPEIRNLDILIRI